MRVCRVVNGVRGVRLGAVGARPGAFNTVRYSEKILERHGISVTTVDLSEILGKAGKLSDDDAAVRAKLDEIRGYAPAPGVPAEKLVADGPARRRALAGGSTPTRSTPRPSSAGPACSRTSAATSAR